jgi:hypothetical protein
LRSDRSAGNRRSQGPDAADLRYALWSVRQVLRPRPRPRFAGQRWRGGRCYCRAIDRRAGNAAHHAHLPRRWRSLAGGGGQSRRDKSAPVWSALPRPCVMSPVPRARRSSSRVLGEVLITDDNGRERERTKFPTARRCTRRGRQRSRRVFAWQPGIRTHVRSSPSTRVW